MRQSRCTEARMVEILREAGKASAAAAASTNQVGERTVRSWRQHFAGLEPNAVRKTKTLDAGSAKVEKPPAERDLEIVAMRDVVRLSGRTAAWTP